MASPFMDHASPLQLMLRLAPHVAPHRGYILLCALLAIMAPAASALTLWWTKRLVDEVLVARALELFAAFAAAYALLAGGKFLLDYIAYRLESSVAERIVRDIRTHLFSHIINASPGTFTGRSPGDIITRLAGDVERTQSLLFSSPLRLFSDIVSLIVFLALLLVLSWKLTLAALLVVPVLALVAMHYSPRIRRLAQIARHRTSQWTAFAEERLGALPAIHAYWAQGREAAGFAKACNALTTAELRTVKLQALSSLLIESAVSGGGIVVLAVGAWEIANGALTVGTLIAFLGGVGALYSPVRSIAKSVASFQRAAAGAERVTSLLDTESMVSDRPAAKRCPKALGQIEFRNISFTYAGGSPALRDISFKIDAGEAVAIVGASGSGKSTIIRLLLRFFDPASGAIFIDGHDIRDMPLQDLRQMVTAVFQEPSILRGSVRDNLLFAAPAASTADMRRALAAACAVPFISQLPQGLNAPVGPHGRRLSGGQQQRLALARAFLRDAPVLVLDEATAAVDGETETLIQTAVKELAGKHTLLVIGHRLASLRGTDRALVIDEGRLVEEGSPADLLRPGSRYSALFASQLERMRIAS